jgi:putative membrane protein insertion efficiency factor
MAKIDQLLCLILIKVIRLYQICLSPFLANCCRFTPSCSTYSVTSIQRYGVLKGVCLTIKRLLCCHPWHPGGDDPVPPLYKRK